MKNHTAVKNRLIFAIVLAFLPLLARAETVNDLYRTVVPVADQSKAEQLRAMRIGLGKVLVKVTGDSQAITNVAFSNPERYVTEFGYVGDRDPQAPEAAASGTGMSLSYAASAIDRLLRQYQLQVWPSDRPALLVWMVVDGAGGKSFVTQENMPAAVSSLKLLMEDRGAPLILPLLDLQDIRNVSENDIWNLNFSKLALAAERYKTNVWLAIRFYQSSSGQWRAARLLNLNGEDDLQNVVANTLPALINKIIPEAVDSLARHYAYVPKMDTEEVMLHLENINDYKNFNQAVGYLESLEVVRRLTVSEVDDHRLLLRLFAEGEVNLLLDTLRRDKRMTEKPLPPLMIPELNDSNTSANDATNILSQTQNLYFMWGRQ
jgi:hypothetical protein